MKKLFFLTFLFSILFISSPKVFAKTTTFYEGEYINGIYMNKYNPKNSTTYYQKARFFRETATNKIAYCIEPFSFFQDNSQYESTLNPDNLTKKQLERISALAHFGYGYKNHQEEKWYAITQLLIWQTADENGDYYFTDSLNGNKIFPFNNEINEINNLINNYYLKPSFDNKEFILVEGSNFKTADLNKIISNYQTTNNIVEIENNHLKATNIKQGNHYIELIRNDSYYNKPIIFYQSKTSQNLIDTGDLEPIKSSLRLNVIRTTLDIIKIDATTKSVTPRGEATLDGAIFEIYNQNMIKLTEVEIKNNIATINNLAFGKYYLKEKAPGKGYTLNNNLYEFSITKENNLIELIIENNVIEKNFTINKEYGDSITLKKEANISFNIYNNKNEFIKTITTDQYGIATITLPYGHYKIEQINSTEGYNKIEPFEIFINEEDITKNLIDYKIPVPNTGLKKKSFFNILLYFFLKLL